MEDLDDYPQEFVTNFYVVPTVPDFSLKALQARVAGIRTEHFNDGYVARHKPGEVNGDRINCTFRPIVTLYERKIGEISIGTLKRLIVADEAGQFTNVTDHTHENEVVDVLHKVAVKMYPVADLAQYHSQTDRFFSEVPLSRKIWKQFRKAN
jgi:hypothetical protein